MGELIEKTIIPSFIIHYLFDTYIPRWLFKFQFVNKLTNSSVIFYD